MKRLFLALVLFASAASAQILPTDEIRYCGPPPRNADGQIIRSSKVLTAFQRIHPCPSTGLPTGACPGWAKDHIIPLACGGCDAVYNLQWLPDALKSVAGTYPKDRWERIVYTNMSVYEAPNCKVGIVK